MKLGIRTLLLIEEENRQMRLASPSEIFDNLEDYIREIISQLGDHYIVTKRENIITIRKYR